MTTATTCDACREALHDDRVRYRLERYDHYGHFDTLDVCSAECLATLAVVEGHERGLQVPRPTPAPATPSATRKWWRR